jgi:predicted enzyme related to lactoylglutathione lyase
MLTSGRRAATRSDRAAFARDSPNQERSTMLKQCKVGAIVFFVRELGRSVAFYRDTLGFEIGVIDGHDGPFAMGNVGEVTLVLIQREATIGESPVVVFGLDGGIDTYAEALAAKGVEIVVPVSGTPDGGLSVDFVDPDRNVLSLYQPAGAPRTGRIPATARENR